MGHWWEHGWLWCHHEQYCYILQIYTNTGRSLRDWFVCSLRNDTIHLGTHSILPKKHLTLLRRWKLLTGVTSTPKLEKLHRSTKLRAEICRGHRQKPATGEAISPTSTNIKMHVVIFEARKDTSARFVSQHPRRRPSQWRDLRDIYNQMLMKTNQVQDG